MTTWLVGFVLGSVVLSECECSTKTRNPLRYVYDRCAVDLSDTAICEAIADDMMTG